MGYAIVAILMTFAGMILGVMINSIGEDSRKALRKKLDTANDTLLRIEKNVLDYSGQLDLVGDQLIREIQFKLNEWKKGALK